MISSHSGSIHVVTKEARLSLAAGGAAGSALQPLSALPASC